jgi:hypothetical protein
MPDPHNRHQPAVLPDRPTPETAATADHPSARPSLVTPTPAPSPAVPLPAIPLPAVPLPATSSPIAPSSAVAADFPRPQYRGAQNRHSILLVAAVAAASLGLGGYFLISSKSNATTPAAYANQSGRITVEVTSTPTHTPAAEAPFAAAVPQAQVVFDPPTAYITDSLTADPGCVGYTDATNASSAALGDTPTAAAATAALAALGASLQKASGQAQDPTLAAALAAEAGFVQEDQPILVTALTSGDSEDEVAAYQPIEDTDDYVSAVCGSDLAATGPND